MAGCGCEELCNCAILDTDCVSVTGDGRATSPYEIGIIIDPNEDNAVECRANGLFAVAALAVDDTDCIALDGTGLAGDPITAEFILSPDSGNRLECRPNGLYAYPCPEVYCCCITPTLAVTVDTASTVYRAEDGSGNPLVCQIEVPEGTWRVSLEILVTFNWASDQAAAPIDFELAFESDHCDPLTVSVECPQAYYRTYIRTDGPPTGEEVDQLVLDTAFDVTNAGPGSLTVNLYPTLTTGALHTATVQWSTSAIVAIVGRVAASQPVNACVVCV